MGDTAKMLETWRKSPSGLRAAVCLIGGLAVLAGTAAAQTSMALLNVQEAIQRTAEGQQLIKQLETKYEPTRLRLESKNADLAKKRDQLQKGANTMSDEARRTLAREIQKAETDLQREAEDARGEFGREQNELFNSVGQKMMAVIDKYSKENGYQIVMDISNPQSPILYAVNEVNITAAIITAYDAAHPVSGAAPAE
ncbi:MAG: OmpH family outer membrane protein [Acidobacteriia bacterium]|nr:OmpH family outer membrane protein [Terriglobia bacterium]MYG03446.1 OmpH family outer membrane protein [Terriglobia bacterium]MYK09311.1 OmpH family outer membrane protein [Terriglobia bacterium]